MHHKLLGSTALVSAGFLMASATTAQAQIEVTIAGFTEFGVTAATDNTLTGTGDRGYDFFMDNEVHVLAQGVTDTGITYGSKIELEAGSGANVGSNPNVFIDEAGLFFSGAFGRLELGRDDGAEDVMFLGAEDAQAGTGGLDGDTANLIPFGVQVTGDAAKISYFTPRVAGFQLGASFTPDTGDDGGDDTGGDFDKVVGAGANWVGAFGGADLALTATGIIGEAEVGGDDLVDFQVGGRAGFAGLEVGATWAKRLDFNEADIYNVGVKFGFGPANASVGYVHHDPDVGPSQNLYVVSADMGLMPGVVLKGDVSYNDEDTGSVPAGQDTWAGVLTVQLNY